MWMYFHALGNIAYVHCIELSYFMLLTQRAKASSSTSVRYI